MSDFVLGAEARHFPAREVGPVVGDDGLGKSKVTHDILPEEFDTLLPYDIGERQCFYLF